MVDYVSNVWEKWDCWGSGTPLLEGYTYLKCFGNFDESIEKAFYRFLDTQYSQNTRFHEIYRVFVEVRGTQIIFWILSTRENKLTLIFFMSDNPSQSDRTSHLQPSPQYTDPETVELLTRLDSSRFFPLFARNPIFESTNDSHGNKIVVLVAHRLIGVTDQQILKDYLLYTLSRIVCIYSSYLLSYNCNFFL